jgi:hypothetical protein
MLYAAQNNTNKDSKHHYQKNINANSKGFEITVKHLKPELRQDPAHIYWLGLDYKKGFVAGGILQDAFELFKTAADLGSYEAMFEVGLNYLSNPVALNMDLALAYFKKYNQAIAERRQKVPVFSLKPEPECAEIKLYALYLASMDIKRKKEYPLISTREFSLLKACILLGNNQAQGEMVKYLDSVYCYKPMDIDFLKQYVAENLSNIEMNDTYSQRGLQQKRKIQAAYLIYQIKKTAGSTKKEVFAALDIATDEYNKTLYCCGEERDSEGKTPLMHAVIVGNFYALAWLEGNRKIERFDKHPHESHVERYRLRDFIQKVVDNKNFSAYDYAYMYADSGENAELNRYPLILESFPEIKVSAARRMCFDWCWYRAHAEMQRKDTSYWYARGGRLEYSYKDEYRLQLETGVRYVEFAIEYKNYYFLRKILASYPDRNISIGILRRVYKNDPRQMLQLFEYINELKVISSANNCLLNDKDWDGNTDFLNSNEWYTKNYSIQDFNVIASFNYRILRRAVNMIYPVVYYTKSNDLQESTMVSMLDVFARLSQSDEVAKETLLSQALPLLSTLCCNASPKVLSIFIGFLMKLGISSVEMTNEIMLQCYKYENITPEHAYNVYSELIKQCNQYEELWNERCKELLERGLQKVVGARLLNMQNLKILLKFFSDAKILESSNMVNNKLMNAYFNDKISAKQLNEIYSQMHQLTKRLNKDEKNSYFVWISPIAKDFPYRSYTPLLAIAAKGDIKALEDCLSDKKEIILEVEKECDENKPSRLLIVAAYFGHLEVVKRLLKESMYIKYEVNRRTIREYISQLDVKKFDFVGHHNDVQLDKEQLKDFLDAYEAVILNRLPAKIHESLKNLFENNLEDFLFCFPDKKDYLRAIAYGKFKQAERLKQPELVRLVTPSAPPLTQRSLASPHLLTPSAPPLTTQSQKELPKSLTIPTTPLSPAISLSTVNVGMFTPATSPREKMEEVVLPGVPVLSG